ncbi:hypothetical protein ACZ11_06660 [Lysinibacillus xylanilyticus]|uniref:Novel STAND NTPase 3 domain-containing protein n=1 Tax=Lysinibacillus xylanilyticus TaxID=582475 RepID=A0A0K9FCM0_9BACI|nr:hypothetical protein [Lysinibacillus xylanilyticus]KMY31866.1 hypothetical protein ACZ11_06660 [Lysinibacillus xylanilyticus]
MTVEVAGPKGYEYQYLMTVYVALKAYDIAESQLIVEKKGGEDAELIIPVEGGINIIEVQVKSEESPLNLNSLAKWMAHFPDASAVGNLLSRLEGDPKRYALFIAKGRCTDETLLFTTKELIQHSTKSLHYPLHKDKVDIFLGFLSNCFGENSDLNKKRREFCQGQSKMYGKSKRSLQAISTRILVWEQLNQVEIEEEIKNLLHINHSIPQAKCESVLRILYNSVTKARDERRDVMPDIRKIISEHISQRMFTGTHTERREIASCKQALKEQHVLLLTGVSFCGKTHTAEYIAETFRNEGYIGFKVSDIDKASRILTDMSTENRVCILEDPFGATELEKDSAEVWSKLNSLITKSGEHRKLIVTSRSDLIQMLTKENHMSKWKIQNHTWFDLTVTDPGLANLIWEQYCEVNGVSDEIRLKIAKGLDVSILQPGQLRHLAFIDSSELHNKSREALEQMAKADSNQLGLALMNKGNLELNLLLLVLGMSTSPTKGLPEKVLFQFAKELGLDSTELFEQAIEYLETHGYISFKNDLWQFTHPTYFEAALFVIEHLGRYKRNNITKLIDISVSSIDSYTLLNIVRKFERIYIAHNNDEFKKLIMDQAFICLKHSSPAVRDAVLPFMISRMSELTYEGQKLLMDHIQSGYTDGPHLDWINGRPVIKGQDGYSLVDFARFQLSIQLSKQQSEDILKKLAYPEPNNFVHSEEAYKICEYLIIFPNKETNIRYLQQLMTYDEAIIRSKVAFFIMKNLAEIKELTEVVLQDRHPFVVKSAIHGCFQAWPYLSTETREELSINLHIAFQKPDICAATNNFMVRFSKEHTSDSIDWQGIDKADRVKIWELWAEFFPIFLNSIPIMFLDVDQPYLFDTIIKSAKYIDNTKIKFSLAEAWFNWLERYLIKSVPQDYGLGITEYLISQVSDPILRRPLGRKLLNMDDSSLVTVSLSEYIYYWDLLSDEEKNDVLELLQSKRYDSRWIRAVALTRKNIPKEILNLDSKVENISHQPIERWSDSLPTSLLSDCLAVVTGYPFILGSIGLVETDVENWRKILFQIVKNPNHSSFNIALDYIIRQVINDRLNEDEMDIIERTWTSLCNHSDLAVRNTCFQRLLEKTVNVNGPNSKRFWTIFFEATPKEEKEKYIQQILKYIERISQNCRQIEEVFGEVLGYEIFTHLLDDIVILNSIDIIKGLPIEERMKFMEEILVQNKPRLFQTINFVKSNFDSSAEQTSRLRELIKERRDEILNAQRIDFQSDLEIENWIFKHRN